MASDASETGVRMHRAPGGPTRHEVEELLIARQSAYDRLDALQLALGYTEDCRVESPIGGAHTGRDAVEQVFRAVFKAFPDHSVRTRAFVIDGNRVAQLLDLAGTDTGGFLGLPATGKPFRVPAVFLYEFRDRLIARERRIYDFTGLLVQVGVLKAKPATTGVTPPGTTSR